MVKVTGFPGLGHKTKNPQALPEGLVEVGGGLFYDPVRGTLQPIPPVFGRVVFFVLFPFSCKQDAVIKQKIPRLCLRDWLRSVADSNRRKRFCRPLPSHSVNRPYSILLKELQKPIQTTYRWRIARFSSLISRAPSLRSVGSNRRL